MMELIVGVARFLADGANWVGEAGIAVRTLDHIGLSAFSMAVAAPLAIPVAVYLGHTGRGGLVAISVVNIGRAVPSFAILALALPVSISMGLGLGFWPTFIALVALALPPMFTNSFTGVREVAPEIVEAALGMGMTGSQVLWKVELPLAAPVILASMRVASVQVVATATLGALVAWGGLGRYIVDGFSQRDNVELLVGGLLVALLSIATELLFELLARWALPRGLGTIETADAVLGSPV